MKFSVGSDPVNVGEIEYEYSLLAKKCGIKMPETRLFEGKYFGTERFDRTPAGKVHTVSAVGLIHADYMDEVVETIRFENKLKYGM